MATKIAVNSRIGKINVMARYSSLDHFTKTRTFRTRAGLRRFVDYWVGFPADVEIPLSGSKVSNDGVGKVVWTNLDIPAPKKITL